MSRRVLYTVVSLAALFMAYQLGRLGGGPTPQVSTPAAPAPLPPVMPLPAPAPPRVTPLTPAIPNAPPALQQRPAAGQLEVVWFMGGSRTALGDLINHSDRTVTVQLLARTIAAENRSGFRLNPEKVEVLALWGEHLDRSSTTLAPGRDDNFALQGVSIRTIPSSVVIRDADGNELPYSEKAPAH